MNSKHVSKKYDSLMWVCNVMCKFCWFDIKNFIHDAIIDRYFYMGIHANLTCCFLWETLQRNNSWRICATVFTAVELHSKIRRKIFFYFEYSSKDPDPKIRWESVLDFFYRTRFFFVISSFFFGILQNITLLRIHYRTQLQYVTYNNLLRTHY